MLEISILNFEHVLEELDVRKNSHVLRTTDISYYISFMRSVKMVEAVSFRKLRGLLGKCYILPVDVFKEN